LAGDGAPLLEQRPEPGAGSIESVDMMDAAPAGIDVGVGEPVASFE
jgi:hypothetical protein